MKNTEQETSTQDLLWNGRIDWLSYQWGIDSQEMVDRVSLKNDCE